MPSFLLAGKFSTKLKNGCESCKKARRQSNPEILQEKKNV